MAKLLSITLALSAASTATAYTVVAMKGFMVKNIDPIVKYGLYTSHMHTFFGSDPVNITTTTSAELQTGCTTAENLNDHSAYWTPTLYYTGAGDDYKPIFPYRFSAYYENIADAEIPIPVDFKLVAGSPASQTQDEVLTYHDFDGAHPVATWYCEKDDAPADKEPTAFPEKTCTTHLQHLLYFHDCVNPDDISEHTYSDVSYGTTNRCPKGQKRIPRLRFSVRYDLRKIIKKGWNGPPPLALACGTSHCAHGDFINGWDGQALTVMMKATSKTEYSFTYGSLASKKGHPTCTAKDSDPNHGTNDYLKSVAAQGKKKRGMEFWA